MLRKGLPFSPAVVPLVLALAGCANNSSHFESGLKDAALGKPAIGSVPTSEASLQNEASLDAYRIDNIKPAERPDPGSDEGGMWLSIEEVENKTRNSARLIRDERLNTYVKNIVCKITGPYCPGIRVYLMRSPAFNASMYPNGMMHVNSGLLLRARNEAEMVAVLGHEFGHYLRRHSIQRQRDIVAKSGLLAFASIALATAGAPAGTADLMGIAAQASIQAYSRDHEREADGYGLRILFDNGYDLQASPEMWKRVAQEREMAGQKDYFNPITDSHPPDAERLTEQKKIADALTAKAKGHELGRERYLDFLLPFRTDFLEDEISTKPQKEALALLDILIEDGLRPGELYFFKGEVHRQSAAKDGAKEALGLYDKALKSEGFPPEVYKSRALANLSLGNKEKARGDLETYLQNMPQAKDAHLVRMQIEELK